MLQESNVTQISKLLVADDLIKRLPSSNIKENVETIIKIAPEIKSNLQQRIETPLGTFFDHNLNSRD